MSAAETVVRDAVAERRAWKAGYDSGVVDGFRRVWQSAMFAEVVDELVLLREVAMKLGEKADYWMARADEMELAAEYWHGVAADAGEFCNRLQNRAVSP